ncbi:MAG: cyclopropane-fatty-acyl-phospholipid synthase family protein [Myxococcales bacterium]|nr:cyclopropane-fatty-acyl-phospholipid synthase family protein [Myxococcales bacterium]
MNQTTTPELAPPGPALTLGEGGRASDNDEAGRSHGLPFILWVLEQRLSLLLMLPTAVAAAVTAVVAGSMPLTWVTGSLVFGLSWLAVPLLLIGVPVALLVYRSHQHDAGATDWEPYVSFRDPKEAARWQGKKIPMEKLYEAYIAEKLDFKQDVYETMLRRNKLFRFCFTWGDVKFYFKEFLRQNVTHTEKSDHGDIAHVYNRGNDFYNFFLGDTMVYTSGIFHDTDETLEQAQERKLETVCKYVQMKPGDRHLDIGCGWGPLITHAAQHYGSHSTGITLAQEQADWANKRAADAGVADRVKVIVDDYRNLPATKYDKITCLEMAEHVGIKNFQKFLLQVRSMLADDGIFYLQIAGLRRPWQYEDLVWGLFMGKYIFPGADASCPLGFVVSQAERAGFEVHRVENCGVHYAETIRKWYHNWLSNEEAVVAKYGQWWFRLWSMFLAWSVIIGGQGSSTVFMVTLCKNTKNDRSTVSPEEAKHEAYSRTERWIGPDPIATQQ